MLGKRWRNSVLLVGPAGVGKSSLVRGLARLMADGGAPEHLRGRRLLRVAEAGHQSGPDGGQTPSDRAVTVVDGLERVAGDERAWRRLMELVSAGGQVVAEVGERDAGALAEREAVSERFAVVRVAALTPTETVEVLKSHRAALEEHHGVRLPDDVLELAAALAANVVPPRVLPGTAVDLADEAASREAVSGRAASRQAAMSRTEEGPAGGAEEARAAVTQRVIAEVAASRSGVALEKIWRG